MRSCSAQSTSEAYGWLFKLLCDAHDEVLVPAPGYPLLDWLADLEGVSFARYPLRYDGRWCTDVGAPVGQRTNPRRRGGQPRATRLGTRLDDAECEAPSAGSAPRMLWR